ncbi:MAG: transglycosylase domain-containing protein [Methylocystis sp.]
MARFRRAIPRSGRAQHSADLILELYLNRVYFGSGAYGAEAAAERYFGHSAKTIRPRSPKSSSLD